MATSSLNVKSTYNGKTSQKAITNINPNATAANLSTFAQMVNALSEHTYTGADLVDKINVDTETRPGGGGSTPAALVDPTLTVVRDIYSEADDGIRIYTITTNSEGHVTFLAFYVGDEEDDSVPKLFYHIDFSDSVTGQYKLYIDTNPITTAELDLDTDYDMIIEVAQTNQHNLKQVNIV